jgi:hypothetical protein
LFNETRWLSADLDTCLPVLPCFHRKFDHTLMGGCGLERFTWRLPAGDASWPAGLVAALILVFVPVVERSSRRIS